MQIFNFNHMTISNWMKLSERRIMHKMQKMRE